MKPMLPLFCLSTCRSVGRAVCSARKMWDRLRYEPIDCASTRRTREGSGALCSTAEGAGLGGTKRSSETGRTQAHMRVQSQCSGRAPNSCSRVFGNGRRQRQKRRWKTRIRSAAIGEASDATGDGSTRARVQGTFLRRSEGRRVMRLTVGNCDTANAVDAGGPKGKRNRRLGPS